MIEANAGACVSGRALSSHSQGHALSARSTAEGREVTSPNYGLPRQEGGRQVRPGAMCVLGALKMGVHVAHAYQELRRASCVDECKGMMSSVKALGLG